MLLYGILFLLGYICGYVSCDMLYNLNLITLSDATVIFSPAESNTPMVFFILAGILAVGLVYFYWFKGDVKKCVQALSPMGFLIIIPLFPDGIWKPIFYVAVLGICIYRVLIEKERIAEWKFSLSEKWCVGIISLLYLFLAIMAFYIQYKTYWTYNLCFYDWCDYWQIANNTLHGRWFATSIFGTDVNYLGIHFSPLPFAILTLWVALFPSTYALFGLSSFLIYLPGPLIYLLGRKLKLPNWEALILTIIYMLSPSLSNMAYCSMYGFHFIYFVMPLVILFFMFYETKHYWPAFVMFGVSLLVQETVPAFWIGVGAIFFVQGRRKSGLAMIISSMIYMLTIIKFVMPYLLGGDTYVSFIRYPQLGNSITQVALSPLLNPGAFWGSLFRPECCYFGAMLLIPVFILALSRPLLLLGGGLTFVFICLQNNNTFQNIGMHYQSEIVALIGCCCVLAAVYNRESERVSSWWKFLATGLKEKLYSKRCYRAALLTSLFTVALSYYFLGMGIWGKVKIPPSHGGEWRSAVTDLKKIIPSGAGITATRQVCPYFLNDYCISPYMNYEWGPVHNKLREYVIIDLLDFLHSRKELELLVEQLRSSSQYALLFNASYNGSHFLLFGPPSRSQGTTASLKLKEAFEAQWANGSPVPINDDNFSVRTLPLQINGLNGIQVLVRKEKEVVYNIDIATHLSDGNKDSYFYVIYGDGLHPAYRTKLYSIYAFNLMLTSGQDAIKQIEIKLIKPY